MGISYTWAERIGKPSEGVAHGFASHYRPYIDNFLILPYT